MLLAKKINFIEISISNALIISQNNHDKFISVNNLFRVYNEMKEEKNKSWKCCGIYYINIKEN